MTIKYINNRELIAEIQRSKATYGYFVSSDYHMYDVVLTSLESLTSELLTSTIATKASKMSTKAAPVDPSMIDPESIVFRVMTDAHLPPETDEKRRRKSNTTGEWVVKPNFPPYKHYVMRDGVPVEVGRSHWKDGFENGHFCITHGKITNRLAQMFMMLTEQYSHRGNWRSYCVDEETEALTQRGWLNMHQITEDDIILSYDEGKLKWSKIKSIFRDDYEGDMFHLTVIGMDALVTPHHKFVTDKGLKEVEYLLEKDRIVLSGTYVDLQHHTMSYSDSFVELVGWFVTEGSCYVEEGRNYTRVNITQNEGVNADRIRKCLADLDVQFGQTLSENDYGNMQANFILTKMTCEGLLKVAPNKVLSMEFILSLSQEQRMLLIDTMIAGDGWLRQQHGENGLSYCQKNKDHVDTFVALCTMAGYRTSCKLRDIVSFGKPTEIHTINLFTRGHYSTVENIDFHGGKRNGHHGHIGRGKASHPNEPTVPYKGMVWCPQTEYGSFMARRNGYVYLTGNTYREEFIGHALMHLSQVALQFDESRSDNPFAFYTQIVKHCLGGETMILTREHGSIAIEDVAEQDVHLLDGNGEWVQCHIYDHGIQETQLTYFQGGNQRIGIWSTAEHGWVSDGKIVKTKDFAGHNTKIDDLRPAKVIGNDENYRRGVIHGLIYGDGHYQRENGFCLQICSHSESIIPYMEGYSWWTNSQGYPQYYVGKAWADLKAFPEQPGNDLDYLLGFFRGWFAADGCVSKVPTPTLYGDVREYEWLKQWGPLVGWHVNSFTKLAEETNFGRRKKISLNFHLRKSSMDANDFLIQQHRERWLTRPATRKGNQKGKKYDWNVIETMRQTMSWAEVAMHFQSSVSSIRSSYCQHKKAVRELDDFERSWHVYGSRQDIDEHRLERVYCPVVETTYTFALACGVHSRNCFTRILNLERRNQNIRDDLLIMAGAQPSYTRQVDNEIEQREELPYVGAGSRADPERNLIKKESKEVPKKRGRKPKVRV